MTDIAATVLSTISSAQVALSTIQSLLALTAYKYPPACTITNGSYVDYIIVGCGSAGSILASRLSEDSNVTVQAFEAGAVPPLEATLPLAFPVLPLSAYEYNFTAKGDGYTAQNLIGKSVGVTAGKMIGGSGDLDHMIHVRPTKHDMDEWVSITGDDSWSYDNVQTYLNMQEHLIDEEILKSSYASNHGTTGPKFIKRQTSDANKNYFQAFEELGHTTKIDVSDETQLGVTEPLLNIANGERNSTGLTYLNLTKNRTNLCLSMSSNVVKILINAAGKAYGVQVVDSDGNIYEVYANREVIVTAGTINTAKLLQLSGIGNSTQLKAVGITPVADLPVGQDLQDHLTAPLLYQMAPNTDATAPLNPHLFPTDMHTLYAALNSSQGYPDYQVIGLLFPHDSTALVQLASNVFKISNEITNKFYAASNGRDTYFAVHNLMKPKSRGSVQLKSSDYNDDPIINLGLLSNDEDRTFYAKCLQDFHQVVNTTYFKSVNATLVDAGLCSGTSGIEFWECYAVAMSNTMWHYSSTAPMGQVLDSKLKVLGISGLRVAGAPAMPTVPSGNIAGTVCMVAEKAAALIKSEWA